MAEEKKCERIAIMLPPALLQRADEWGWRNRIRSRGEVLRRLIECGLDAEGEPGVDTPSSDRG